MPDCEKCEIGKVAMKASCKLDLRVAATRLLAGLDTYSPASLKAELPGLKDNLRAALVADNH